MDRRAYTTILSSRRERAEGEQVEQLSSPQDKPICDAYDCRELATETIGVGAGELGIIELNVCENCAPKFRDRDMMVDDNEED